MMRMHVACVSSTNEHYSRQGLAARLLLVSRLQQLLLLLLLVLLLLGLKTLHLQSCCSSSQPTKHEHDMRHPWSQRAAAATAGACSPLRAS